jgi:hypothetical protein
MENRLGVSGPAVWRLGSASAARSERASCLTVVFCVGS